MAHERHHDYVHDRTILTRTTLMRMHDPLRTIMRTDISTTIRARRKKRCVSCSC